MSQAEFAVGIDLGTTNSVLSFVRLDAVAGEEIPVDVLAIPQLVTPGAIESRPQLPSFLYQAHPDEIRSEDCTLPWSSVERSLVGEIARHLGSKTPIRLVGSAKSWLSHAQVDRKSPILPVQSPPEVTRISPLDASTAYLRHLKSAWDAQFPESPLADQDLVITVPASFDPGARELTVEAARRVGLGHAVLLEEPQSAVYSWIQASGGEWRNQVRPGETILVVDVGGGTTDFSLIAVSEAEGSLTLERVAIGDHILLGGDNMDLALAYGIRAKLDREGKRLEPWQLQCLTHGARDAKEKLLGDASLTDVAIAVPSRGSSLIGGTLRTNLTRDEVLGTVVDGFFPMISIESRPQQAARAGLTTLSLPYAQDARITAHLAAFLSRHIDAAHQASGLVPEGSSRFLHPSAVLLNGGVFRSKELVDRLLAVINRWLEEDGASPACLLDGIDLDLAVSRGAAYYGNVRNGPGVRIRGGTGAAYYVGVESSVPAVPGIAPPLEALCIAPFGMEEGSEAALPPYEFGLIVGEPVHFRFFSSKVRRLDEVGTRLDWWAEDELQELAAIEITLPAEQYLQGEVVPVVLGARVTETGTLQLEAVARDGGQRWKVEFEVREREASSTDIMAS
ncbi:MAG: hypothetical protein RLZ25_637 [Pseudomonadota bacterium]